MKEFTTGLGVGLTIGLVVVLVLCIVAENMNEDKWKTELIKRGFAEYNQTTGEWQWKHQEVK